MVAYPEWCCVSPDTGAAPKGGAYGHVDWFIREAARRGILVAWNWWMKCYAIYHHAQGRPIFDMNLNDGLMGKPKPMTRELLDVLVFARERFCRTGERTLRDAIREMVAAASRERIREKYREVSAQVATEALHETALRTGRRTPAVQIIVPHRYGRWAARG